MIVKRVMLIVILSIFLLFFISCAKATAKPVQNPIQTPQTPVKQDLFLSDIQITACNTAHNAGTCDTRLAELGIVLKEDCCKSLGKCC